MKFDKTDYTIGSHFVVALEYGDETGLSDQESQELAEFIESLPKGHNGSNHWSWGDSDEFARCEISGMMGHCTQATYLHAAELKVKSSPSM